MAKPLIQTPLLQLNGLTVSELSFYLWDAVRRGKLIVSIVATVSALQRGDLVGDLLVVLNFA